MTAAAQALSEDELAVVRATDRDALAGLDEDALLDLHAQIRRARTKYVGQYRRQASARVSDTGGRGKARPQNQRARDKAEIFEAALARVSTALAKAARESAAQLARRSHRNREGGQDDRTFGRAEGTENSGHRGQAPTTEVRRTAQAGCLRHRRGTAQAGSQGQPLTR